MINAIPPVVPAGRMRDLPQPEFDLPGGMRLRPWAAPTDAPALVESCLDPDIRHWNRPSLLDLPGAEDRIARWHTRWQDEEASIWAIAPASGAPAVGLIGLADLDLTGGSGEILYWLRRTGRPRSASPAGPSTTSACTACASPTPWRTRLPAPSRRRPGSLWRAPCAARSCTRTAGTTNTSTPACAPTPRCDRVTWAGSRPSRWNAPSP